MKVRINLSVDVDIFIDFITLGTQLIVRSILPSDIKKKLLKFNKLLWKKCLDQETRNLLLKKFDVVHSLEKG